MAQLNNLTTNPLAGYTQAATYQPLKYESLTDRIRQIDEAIKQKAEKPPIDISKAFTAPSLPFKSGAIKNLAMTPEGEMLLPFDVGRPLGQAEARQTPIPEGYQFEVDPGIKAFLGSLPESVGGGQFAVDPEQTDRILKSIRGYESVEDATLRGGLSPRLFQIDHIVPLWAGGVDTRANKQILDTENHTRKTQVDAVARALYYNNDIKLNEARIMVMNWQDKNTEGITLDEKIETPLETAKTKYKEWQNPPKFGFMDVVKGLPKATVELTRTVESLLPTPAQSAIEGAISGFFGGWIPTTAGNERFIFADDDFEPSKITQTVDKIARRIGSVGGTILSFMALKGAVGILGRATGLTKAWNATRIAQQPLLRIKGIGTVAEQVTRNIYLKGVLENMGLFALHGAVSRPEVNNFTDWVKARMQDLGTGAFFGVVSPIPNKFTSTALLGTGVWTIDKLKGASDEDALMDAITISGLHLTFRWQADRKAREAYIQNEATKNSVDFRNEQLGVKFKERVALNKKAVTRALGDAAAGIERDILGKTTTAGKFITMEGGNTELGNAIRAIDPSTIQSQGQFYTKVKDVLQTFKADTPANLANVMRTTTDFFNIFRTGIEDAQMAREVLKEQYPVQKFADLEAKIAAQKATEKIKLTRQDLINIQRGVMKDEAKLETYKKLAAVPRLGEKTALGIIGKEKYSAEFLDIENKVILDNITQKWQNGLIDDIQAEQLRQGTYASAKQLYKQQLPRNARWIEDMRDLFSLGVKVKKAPVLAQTGIPNDLAVYMENNVKTAGKPSSVVVSEVSPEIQTKIIEKNLVGEMSITGVGKGGFLLGDDIVPEANKNLIEAAKIYQKDPNRIAPNMLIALDDSAGTQERIKLVNTQLEQAVKDGKIKPEDAIPYDPANVLANYLIVDGELTMVGHWARKERIGEPIYDEKGNVTGYKGTPNNKNQWIYNYNQSTGRNLTPLNPELNNENLGNAMRELGISTFEAPIVTMAPKGVFSDNPHLIVNLQNINWLESYAKNKGIPMQTEQFNMKNMQAVQETMPYNASEYAERMGIKETNIVNQLTDVLEKTEILLKEGNAKNLQTQMNAMLGNNFFDDVKEAQNWIDNKYGIKVQDVISSWEKVNQSGGLTTQGQLYFENLAEFFESSSITKESKQKLMITPLLSKTPLESTIQTGQKIAVEEIAKKVQDIVKPTQKQAPMTMTMAAPEKIMEVKPEGREITTKEIKQVQKAIKQVKKIPVSKKVKPDQATIQEAITAVQKIVKPAQEQAPMVMKMITPQPAKTTITTKTGVKLGKEILPGGQYWLEQNVQKAGGKWTPVAKAGYKVEHLMDNKDYAGKIRINDTEYGYPEAEEKFLKPILAGQKPEIETIQKAITQMTMTMAPKPSEMRLYDVPTYEKEATATEPEVHETLDIKEQIQREIEIPEEVIDIKPNNYRMFEDGINKGFDDLISNQQKEAYDTQNFERVKELEIYKDKFSNKNLTAKIKQFYDAKNPDKSFEIFEQKLYESLKQHGIPNPFLKKEIFRTKLKRLFIELPNLEQRKIAIIKGGAIVEIADTPSHKSTFLHNLNHIAIEEGKLPKDAFEILHLDARAYEEDVRATFQKLTSVDREQQIRRAFENKGYIPIGVSGADLATFFGIKMATAIDDKLISLTPLVEAFNKNPENYKFDIEGDVDLKIIPDVKKTERVYMVDVLGMEKEMTHNKMMKRWKIVNNDDLVNQVKNQTYRYLIAESPKLQDIEQYNTLIDKTLFAESTTSQDKASLKIRTHFDGKHYTLQETSDELHKANAYTNPDRRRRIKGVAFFTWKENGKNKMFMHKGDTMVMDEYHKKLFTRMFGRPIQKNDWITFTDNVKTAIEGKQRIKKIENPQYKEGDLFSVPYYYEIEVPSEAHRFKYLSIPKQGSAIATVSSLSKFFNDKTIGKDLFELYKPHIDKLIKLNNELNANFYNPEKVKEILKSEEYADFKIDLDNLYKRHKIKLNQGAGAKALNKQIDSILNRIFNDVITGRTFLKGANLSFSPDVKVKLLPNGERTLMDNGEVMVNRKTVRKIIGDPKFRGVFSAIAVRNPSNKETNLTVVKVLTAEDHKIYSLGDEHAIVNGVDTFLRYDGDFDGDIVELIKIGGKDGLPVSLAKKIKEIHNIQGEMILNIEAAKFMPKAPLSENFAEISQAMMLGADGVRMAAASNRINPQLVDNQWKIKINPKNNRIEVSFGEKKLTDEEFLKLFNDEGQRPKIFPGINFRNWKMDDINFFKGLGEMEFSAKWGIKEKKITGYISQASVDAPKYPVLSQIGYDSTYLPARTLQVKTDQTTRDKIVSFDETRDMEFINNQRILKTIAPVVIKLNEIFNYARKGAKIPNNKLLSETLKRYNQTANYAEEGGANKTPLQIMMQNFETFKPFLQVARIGIVNPDISSSVILRSDIAAANAVRAKFITAEMQRKLTSHPVREFMQKVEKARRQYVGNPNLPKKQQGTTPAYNDIMQYYKDNIKKYSRNDLEAISFWTATAIDSNVAYSPYYPAKNIKFVRRLDDLFLPEHAKVYYYAFETAK